MNGAVRALKRGPAAGRGVQPVESRRYCSPSIRSDFIARACEQSAQQQGPDPDPFGQGARATERPSGRSEGAGGDWRAACRFPALARPADRIPAQDPGPARPSVGVPGRQGNDRKKFNPMAIGWRRTFLRLFRTGNTSSLYRECCDRSFRAGADCSASCAISWSDCCSKPMPAPRWRVVRG